MKTILTAVVLLAAVPGVFRIAAELAKSSSFRGTLRKFHLL